MCKTWACQLRSMGILRELMGAFKFIWWEERNFWTRSCLLNFSFMLSHSADSYCEGMDVATEYSEDATRGMMLLCV